MFDKSMFKLAETWTFLDLPEYQTVCLLEKVKIFFLLLIFLSTTYKLTLLVTVAVYLN